ncbi:glutaredoxin 3 [Psychromonas ingrahamii 37]|uniref:Glutaredoxin n=1 Tax=Psychromonas ingrahamii (strain DSM 17664 / CCUG 51855 / 37) TaxID=357804 RepID=A1SZI1_PSYIN|nr:glutaredoxin 3 [Psychromonas ingrahamii 37]
MATIVIYTTSWCPFCTRAKKLLDHKNVTYTEVDVSSSDARAKMVALTGGSTVPQLLINDKPEGGCDELYALERSGKLDKLLSQ